MHRSERTQQAKALANENGKVRELEVSGRVPTALGLPELGEGQDSIVYLHPLSFRLSS